MFSIGNSLIAKSPLLIKNIRNEKKNENFIAVYPQNNHYLSYGNSSTSKNCLNDSALPANMAARALDKKYILTNNKWTTLYWSKLEIISYNL